MEHSPDGIADGVAYAMSHQAELRAGIKALREEKYAVWQDERAELVRLSGLAFSD